jgi:membrane protease YdiL (CAAX protease family)
MRSFVLFVALLAISLVVAAALTYPAWLLVNLISIQPLHRVMHRLAMLLALCGLIYLTRRLQLSNKVALGYGLPRTQFLQQLLLGWLCGLALMLPLVALLLGLDVREWRAEFAADTSRVVALIFAGVASGLAIAFIEETFFRGVLYSAIAHTSRVAAAVVAPSILYALVHFFDGRLRVPTAEVTWSHGFAVLVKLFDRYGQPLSLADSFLALFALGVLLSLVRWRTGAIAACVGLHAAGIAAIAVLRAATQLNPASPEAWLAGTYDGVIGWAALLWFALIAGVFIWFAKRAEQRLSENLG